jgi:hypothetical protein
MRRLLCSVLFAAVVTAAAAAGPNPIIAQHSIGGARLNLTRTAYTHEFGKPSRVDELEGGIKALVYPRFAVFLKGGKGIAVSTSSRAFRTQAGVGPCSLATRLHKAYGNSLYKVRGTAPVTIYRVGNLVFRVFHGRVGAVTLGKGQLALLITRNARDCS